MSQGFTKDYIVKATGETSIFVNGTKVDSTSGTSIDFTVPAGIKEFKVALGGVSTDTASPTLIRLGDAGGIEATGYTSTCAKVLAASSAMSTSTTGFIFDDTHTAYWLRGIATFVLIDAATNSWSMTNSGYLNTATIFVGGGVKALSGELTTIRLTSVSGTANFDSGTVNIQYENPDLAVSGVESVAAGVTDVFTNGTKQASTSGTAYDFVIPSGVKEFKLVLDDVSFDVNSALSVQLGDAGGIEATGYDSVGSYVQGATTASVTDTTGFNLANTGATLQWCGIYHGVLLDAATNTWVISGTLSTGNGTTTTSFAQGSKSLSGELTTVRLTTEGGTAVGDNGALNIQYEAQDLDLGSGVISGGVIQTVNTQDGVSATGTTVLPFDNTTPQITEGDEYLSASITPTNVANKLRIDVKMNLADSGGNWLTCALFQDATADALCVTDEAPSAATRIIQNSFTYWMDAGTTDSTTFSVRAGKGAGATIYFNSNSTALHNSLMFSSITITEYKV